MTNYFFERYWPEICRGLHKWCYERILRRFRLFRAKKKFLRIGNFFTFFAYPGSQISWKMTNFFFERYGPEIFRGLHKWCCERILKRFRLFRGKKIFFLKICFFWLFLHIRGSQISWKMTNFFFEKYRPEICRGLHKWCCEQILRHLRLFRGKKNFFLKTCFFDFFCISGVTDFLKNDQLLFWEIPAWNLSNKFHKWCCEQILRHLRLFRAKKFFSKNLKFFDFFCISGVTDFLKNDQRLFWETAPMVLRTNFKAFKVVSSEKKFFQKFEIFWLFLHIRGHRFLEKWPTSFLRDTDRKFVVDCTNGVANEF